MNKSFITNLITIIILGSSFIDSPVQNYLRAIGLFAFSGAITNWLAVYMLFEKVPFLYGSGIIAREFEQFRESIKHLMMTEFFQTEQIESFLSDSTQELPFDIDMAFEKLKSAIIDSQFGGMLNMFGGEAALEPLKPKFEVKIKEMLIESVPVLSQKLGSSVEVIIDKRMQQLTPQMVKTIIQNVIKEHLGWLVIWGGVFGGLIGLLSELIV